MNLEELKSKHKLLKLFVELCEIPSPPLKETAVAEKIISILRENNISVEYDEYQNVIARIPGCGKYHNAPPILLSAHMDVVGSSDKVNTRLSENKKYIETDKSRTLGADNKAGVAAIVDLITDLAGSDCKKDHGPVEATFTRDEEKGMTGMRSLNTAKLKSKYAIIADGEKLGELDCEGAGFTNVFVKIYGSKGGHSGINIHEKDRISAIKVLSEIDSKIPQGVYKIDPEKGVVTSINAGLCSGGTAGTYISDVLREVYELSQANSPIPDKYSCARLMETANRCATLNVIASEAQIAYSIRSSEPENEKLLIKQIKDEVDALNQKYQGLIQIKVDIQHHLMPFVRSEDDSLAETIIKAAKKQNIPCSPSCFHAGAETHILGNEKENFYGERFNPVIIGLANLENIHSSDEKIDWQSFLRGRAWLEEIITRFAEDNYG